MWGSRRRWSAALLLVVVTLAGCGRVAMSPDEATQVAIDAFAAAALDPEVGQIDEGATVDRAIDGEFIQVHQVEMIIDEQSYLAGVDRKQGAVVRLIEPNDTALTEQEVMAIAAYRSNPADDAAQRVRALTWVIIVLAAIGGSVLFFRRERLRAELAADDAEEISLT